MKAGDYESRELDEGDFIRFPVRGFDYESSGEMAGEAALPKDTVIGQPYWVDGYAYTATDAHLTPNESVYRSVGVPVPKVLPKVKSHAILLSFPDYPCPEARTYVMGVEDAEKIGRYLLDAVADARRLLTRQERTRGLRAQEFAEELSAEARDKAVECSWEGCRRQRRFFDEKGNGYCKRHADEQGIRPKGKS